MMTKQGIRDQFLHRILLAFGHEKKIYEAEFLNGGKPKPMERMGIFIPDSPHLTAYCPRCDDYTPVEVRQEENGDDSYWRVCCGPLKRLSPNRFRQWQVRQEPFIDLFREKVGIKGTMTELVPDRIWKLGRRGQRVFVYISRVMIPDLQSYGPILSRFSNAILVTTTYDYLERLNIVLPNRGIILSEVSRLDKTYSIIFDMEKIEAIIEPEAPVVAKPTARRGNRTVNIEKLIHELYQYLTAARDHLWTTGELLPKPSLQDLGRMAGIAKHTVTRCMQDPDADKLRHCWKYADDPEFVRHWKAK